jgi:3-oxoacyl-ACP reductase-like protein
MAIETLLERIAVALEALASQPAPTAAPAPAPAPAPAAAPAPAPVAPATTNLPFADAKGLIAYITEAYQSMGPEKGMQIQSIMQNMGVDNINNLPAEQYSQFYTAVEQLKAA